MPFAKARRPCLLSVVIPAFNEADNLAPVMRDTVATLDASPLAGRYELLVVDDGSTDGTAKVADEQARLWPAVRVFHHPQNLGLGSALRTGYRNSRGEFVSFCPADGEVRVDQVLRLYEAMGDADLMTSNRVASPGVARRARRRFHREFLTWAMRMLTRLLLGFDPSRMCGIYVIRGPLVRSLPLQANTGMVGLELLAYCRHKGAKMRHGGITICPRLSGRSKVATVGGVYKQFREVFRLRRQVRLQLARMAERKAA